MSLKFQEVSHRAIRKTTSRTSDSNNLRQYLLSEGNLETLQRHHAEIERASTPSGRVPKRRIMSRQLSFSDLNLETLTVSTSSPKSPSSPKFYRYDVLQRAGVFVLGGPPSPEIQVLLDDIFGRQVSQERRSEIALIASRAAHKFISKARGAHGEDDLVEALYVNAFCEMFPHDMFNCPRKAGMVLLCVYGMYIACSS